MKTTMNQAYMARMAQLMSQALESPEGMRALAAAIAAPIEQEIARKEISSLLLTQHTLPKGERPLYQKKPRVKAYWISTEGEIREQQLGQDEVELSTNRIHSNPMVDVSVLKNGNIGTLMDIQQAAADEIRKEIDKRTITVVSAAVPSANTIEVAGSVVTAEAMNEAISLLEDLELSAKYIVMRGRRFNDLRGWDLDPQTQNELRTKGVIKNYGTGGILLTASAALNEVLILPEDEVGKMPIRETLKTEAIDRKERFKTGWLVWSELGQGILRPDILVKIKLLGVNNPPTVSLSNPSAVNLVVTVVPTASDGDNGLAQVLVLWGDGESTDGVTSGQDYHHTYATAGTYRITLVATDTSGQTSTASKTVTVTAG
jgi:hypothetical protein